MNLKEWTAKQMIQRISRVYFEKITWELLDYEFFKVENERGSFFTSKKEAKAWWKSFKNDIENYKWQRLIQINGLTEKELSEMSKKELTLLIINNMAEEILSEMPIGVEWEDPVVWTPDLLKQSGLGHYMEA